MSDLSLDDFFKTLKPELKRAYRNGLMYHGDVYVVSQFAPTRVTENFSRVIIACDSITKRNEIVGGILCVETPSTDHPLWTELYETMGKNHGQIQLIWPFQNQRDLFLGQPLPQGKRGPCLFYVKPEIEMSNVDWEYSSLEFELEGPPTIAVQKQRRNSGKTIRSSNERKYVKKEAIENEKEEAEEVLEKIAPSRKELAKLTTEIGDTPNLSMPELEASLRERKVIQ